MIRSARLGLVSALVVVVVLVQVAGFAFPIATHAKAAPLALRIGFLSGIESLSPFRGINDADYLFYGLVYDYLFALDEDGNPEPNIATDATPDAYGANWTYTIRTGVQWHDGSDLTVDDVAFSINKNVENFFQLWAYEPYVNRVVQCGGGQTTNCGAVVTNRASNQVTVYFDRPFVPGKALYVPIIQEAQWGSLSPSQIQYNYENLNPIGTGQYKADANIGNQWKNGEPLVLHRNTNYHLGPLAIDDIYLVHYSDEVAMVQAMLAGDLDVAEFTPAGYATLAGKPNIARQESLLSTQYWVEIGFQQYDLPSVNNNLNPARWDINVRRALAMATNKDFVVNTIYQGKGVRGSSLMSPLTPFWHYDPADPTMEPDPTVNLTFDLAKANQLLDAAGYDTMVGGYRYATNDISVRDDDDELKTVPAGTKLSFRMGVRQEYVQEQDTAKYLVEEWKGVGVELTWTAMLEPALSDAVYGGAVETYIWYWSGDPDPNYLLSIQSGFTLDGWSDNYWNNATYNQLYIDHLAAQDPEDRQAIVRAAEKVHYESAVYIILIYNMGTWAYRTDQYTGWGDWAAHPYRQLNAFWTANPLFFDLELAPTNNCPTEPVIQGTPPLTTFVDQNQEFVAESSDPDGNALTWTWDWDDGSTSTNATSGTAGTVTVATSHVWTSPGTYFVSLTVDDTICPVEADPFEVVVTPLPAQTGWINGTVTDAETTDPIQNATVRAAPGGYSDNTGPNGQYSILVPAGTYSVTANKSLYASETQTGVVVDQDLTAVVDFELSSLRGWIVGSVRSTGGANLAGAAIVVVGATQYSGISGSDGGYNVTATPGTYTVTASLTGFISKNQTGVQVNDKAETLVNFVLEPVPQPGISGAVIGAGIAIVVVIAAAVGFLVIRRSRRKKEQEVSLPPPPPSS